mgnify:CR=1 FL=1
MATTTKDTAAQPLREAAARMEARRKHGPRALAVRYERYRKQVVVTLAPGLELAFSPGVVEGLSGAGPAALSEIEISPSQLGLHFPRLDADVYLPALLEGFTGSHRWMAAAMGKRGGSSRSEAKGAASRANGRLGGRPRKGA